MAFDTNTVLTIMKTDTSQAEAAVKRLRGVERTRAKEMLDDLNAQNKGLEGQLAMFTKVGAAIGIVVGVYKLLSASVKDYLEDQRLETAAAGANLKGLQDATLGLVEADNLLAFAAKSMHGEWRLSQKEMELVLQGANALRHRFGGELTPTVEKLATAFAKGSTKSLREFGIEAKDKTSLIEQLERRVASLGGKTAITGDDFERAGVQWRDAVDDLKGALGRLGMALGPVISDLAKMTSGVADAVHGVIEWDRSMHEHTEEFRAWLDEITGFDTELRRVRRQGANQTVVGPTLKQETTGRALTAAERAAMMGPGGPQTAPWGFKEVGEGRFVVDWTAEDRLRMMQAPRGFDPWQKIAIDPKVDELKVGKMKADSFEFIDPGWGRSPLSPAPKNLWQGVGEAPPMKSLGVGQDLPGGAIDTADQASAELRQEEALKAFQARGAAMMKQAQEFVAMQERLGQQSILEKMFGTPAEVTDLTLAVSIASATFAGMTTAAGAAIDAMITGEKSVGDALKSAVAEALRALAVQAGVEALKHVASGIGALAFGLGPNAGQHFAAAAAWGAVAGAAGIGARAMGAGQAPSTSASAATAGSAMGPRGAGGDATATQPRQTVVMVGRDFMGLTDLEQRQLIYQAIQQGKVLDVRSGTISRS